MAIVAILNTEGTGLAKNIAEAQPYLIDSKGNCTAINLNGKYKNGWDLYISIINEGEFPGELCEEGIEKTVFARSLSKDIRGVKYLSVPFLGIDDESTIEDIAQDARVSYKCHTKSDWGKLKKYFDREDDDPSVDTEKKEYIIRTGEEENDSISTYVVTYKDGTKVRYKVHLTKKSEEKESDKAKVDNQTKEDDESEEEGETPEDDSGTEEAA